jgi:hypothetical protein
MHAVGGRRSTKDFRILVVAAARKNRSPLSSAMIWSRPAVIRRCASSILEQAFVVCPPTSPSTGVNPQLAKDVRLVVDLASLSPGEFLPPIKKDTYAGKLFRLACKASVWWEFDAFRSRKSSKGSSLGTVESEKGRSEEFEASSSFC